jgi:putative hemolysin
MWYVVTCSGCHCQHWLQQVVSDMGTRGVLCVQVLCPGSAMVVASSTTPCSKGATVVMWCCQFSGMLGVKGVISSLVGREQCVHVGRLTVHWSLGRNFSAKEASSASEFCRQCGGNAEQFGFVGGGSVEVCWPHQAVVYCSLLTSSSCDCVG